MNHVIKQNENYDPDGTGKLYAYAQPVPKYYTIDRDGVSNMIDRYANKRLPGKYGKVE